MLTRLSVQRIGIIEFAMRVGIRSPECCDNFFNTSSFSSGRFPGHQGNDERRLLLRPPVGGSAESTSKLTAKFPGEIRRHQTMQRRTAGHREHLAPRGLSLELRASPVLEVLRFAQSAN